MMSEEILTRGQALMRIHDHLGETVRFSIRAGTAASGGSVAGTYPVIELEGELTHPVEASEELAAASLSDDTRESFGYLYKVGEQPVGLPPLPGTIRERGNGIDFELADGLTLRVTWSDPNAAEGGDA